MFNLIAWNNLSVLLFPVYGMQLLLTNFGLVIFHIEEVLYS